MCIRDRVEEIVPPGQLDPNHIHTPGIYVNRLIAGTFTKRIEKLTVRESSHGALP